MVSKKLSAIQKEITGRLKERGFAKLFGQRIVKKGEHVFNRSSDGVDSNFFFLMQQKNFRIDCLFTNPRSDKSAKSLKKEEIVRVYKFRNSSDGKIGEMISKVIEFSSKKPTNVYKFIGHEHMKKKGDDGAAKDENYIRQALKWHVDYVAWTPHNMFDLTEYGQLRHKYSMFDITLLPATELTIPPKLFEGNEKSDRHLLEKRIHELGVINGPHFLIYYADTATAGGINLKILSKKYQVKGAGVPGSGPPIELEDQFNILQPYRSKNLLAIILAHPFSAMPSIDLFDPYWLSTLGYDGIQSITERIDGVEMYNNLETHNQLDFDKAEGLRVGDRKIEAYFKNELDKRKYPAFLSPPMLNQLFGEILSKEGLYAFANTDSHWKYDVKYDDEIEPDGRVWNEITIPKSTFKQLKSRGSKLQVDELVKAIKTHHTLGPLREISIKPVVFTKMTNHGPAIVEERQPSKLQKIKDKLYKLKFKVRVGANYLAHRYTHKVMF